MATSGTGPQYSSFDLSGAASLANLFMGKVGTSQNSGGTNTSGSKTTTESVDPAAVQATVKSILEGTQGLAAVASGQKKAGLYNSSTNQLMVNDLIARSAAEASKLNKTTSTNVNEAVADNKSTTTTQKPTLNTQPSQLAAGLIGGLSLIPAETRKAMLAKLGIGAETSAVNTLGNDSTVDPMGPVDSLTRRGDILGSSNVEQTIAPSSNIATTGTASSAPSEPVSNIVPDAGVDGSDEVTNIMGDVGGAAADSGADLVSVGTDVADGISAGADAADITNTVQDAGGDLLGDGFSDVSDLFFAEGGMVSSNDIANRAKVSTSKGPIRKHYASGGIVNTGLKQTDSPLAAIDSISPTFNDQSVAQVAQASTGQSSKTSSSSSSSSSSSKKNLTDSETGNAGGTSTDNDTGANSGAFGNVAGLAPMAGMLASIVTGIPALGLAASLASTAAANAQSADMMGMVNAAIGTVPGVDSPFGTDADSDSDSDSSPAGPAPSTGDADSGSAPGDAPSGDAPSGADSGSASGDAYSQGGSISGEGDETSDSIPIHVSDGEFVVNAAATEAFRPVLEHINNMGKRMMAKKSGGVGAVRRA